MVYSQSIVGVDVEGSQSRRHQCHPLALFTGAAFDCHHTSSMRENARPSNQRPVVEHLQPLLVRPLGHLDCMGPRVGYSTICGPSDLVLVSRPS